MKILDFSLDFSFFFVKHRLKRFYSQKSNSKFRGAILDVGVSV